jgi:hypothetical protein
VSPNDASSWKGEGFGECGGSSAIIHSLFYSGTEYVTEMAGSANTTESAGNAHYEAKITKTNLINAVKLVNSNCAGWHLSENPENYALIGVEQGLEGWHGLSELAGSTSNLHLRTEYTPRPPSATTEQATSVQQTEAVLNGTVNPHGYDTKYYFQYGETTAYGASTQESDAGAGLSPEPEKTTITGLVPGTMYHYRLVATSGGGTSYGLDQIFGTAETSSTVEYKPNGESLVWYVNSSGAIAYWLNSGEKWYPGELGGKVAAGTSPAVEYKPNGETLVWYVNSSGAIAYWLNSGEKWYPGELGGKVAAGTSPTVEYKPNGQTLVYYITSTKGVAYWLNYAEGKWSNGEFGGKAAEDTSPTAEYKPNGETLVWYVNSSNAVAYWLNSGEKWYPGELGGKVAAGTSLALEYKPNGQTLVYYTNSSPKGVWSWLNYEEGKWSNGEL